MIFAKSPRGWKLPEYSEEQFEQWLEYRKKYDQLNGMIHSNYIANLSKPAADASTERNSIIHDFICADKLWYESINVHVGKEKDRKDKDEAMSNMQENVTLILQHLKDKKLDHIQYLFENTAGQWSEIGSTIEELWYFTQNYLSDLPVKFTIDTAHLQWGGVDFGDRDLFLEKFDQHVWVDRLHSIHLNDSKAISGSHLDRHASLGRGFVWFPRFVGAIQRAAKNDIPLYIETPEPERRPDEVEKVKMIARWEIDRIEQFHEENFQTQFLKKFETMRGEESGWLF
jgi:deoxyribonuclease-4